VKPQLFGLHFSGGNAYSLKGLFAGLEAAFDIELLELPGRGRRLDEDLLYTRDEAVADLLRQIRERRTGVPYLVYGHSMGAELGFIIVKEQELANDPPLYFIPTGNAGPNIHKREMLGRLPRAEFFAMLREMGGLTDAILEDEELMEFFEPILRADFQLLEDAEQVHIDFAIDTPVLAMMGAGEKYAADIANWKSYTRGHFDSRLMEGNHFFIHHHGAAIRQAVRDCFRKGLATVC